MGRELKEKNNRHSQFPTRSREGTEITPELKAENNLLVETAKHELVTHDAVDITPKKQTA